MSTRGSEPCYYGAMTDQHRDEAGRYIRYEVADRVASITLTDPSIEMPEPALLEELDEAFMAAAQDLQVNVKCLFVGDHFSGHDVVTPEEPSILQTTMEPGIGAGMTGLGAVLCQHQTLREIPKPTGCCRATASLAVGHASHGCHFAANNAMSGSHFQYFCMPWDSTPERSKNLSKVVY